MLRMMRQDGTVEERPLPYRDEEPTTTIYSDRLFQWDSEKYNRLCMKHFGDHGQMFHARSPDGIEAFLRDYFGEGLLLCSIEQTYHRMQGHPIWVFHIREEKYL